ncbi:hypothetical protein [Pyrodictium occultum]|uniref:hypothetical protein n=1 Tax=Pyrodictium occultum TaxID=2309 RepID=UPI00191BD74C|nr:hypothetical protein [Pyrodictium occultum]
MSEEEGGFYEEMPEDFYAAEELELGRLSKCRGMGKKRKRKTEDRVLEEERS